MTQPRVERQKQMTNPIATDGKSLIGASREEQEEDEV